MSYIEDAKRAQAIVMDDPSYLPNKKSLFRPGYFNTNEDIPGYYNQMDLNEKSLLTVSGSGDQLIYAILYGINEIVAFDYNPMQTYWTKLKIAGFKSLEDYEFRTFFPVNGGSYKTFYGKDLYLKMRDNLDYESKYLWDEVFSLDGRELYRLNPLSYNLGCYPNYTYPEYYNKIKNRINDVDISYATCSLDELPLQKVVQAKKFDVVNLSNIFDHLLRISGLSEEEFLDFIYKNIFPLLNDDAKVIVYYRLRRQFENHFKELDSLNCSVGDNIRILTK